MWGRRRKSKDHSGSGEDAEASELMLGTDDRSEFTATKSSDDLAHELLEEARTKAKNLDRGAEVKVVLTQAHRQIHRMELMASLMTVAPEYGLRAGVQFDNTHSFTKL